ncbi:MAG TPA: hypothetical protein VLH19_04505 [Patescibacteria group bacterium]|nr:hypothetical protein [Patescibacteria group bacterium]
MKDTFLEKLQSKAREQARFEGSSPIPQFLRPFVSIVGLHYWQVLLVISCVLAIPISVILFSSVYP